MQSNSTPLDRPFSFGLTRLMLGISLLVMWVTVSMSLNGFMVLAAALLVAALLVWLFNLAVDLVLGGKHWLIQVLAFLVLVPLATITIGMSGSALWSHEFAQSSLVGYFERQRVPVERGLTATLNQAQAAQKALENWTLATQERALREENEGGSCPNIPQSVAGKRGPVHAFRTADKTIAQALSANVATWEAELSRTVKALADYPAANNLNEVKAGIEVANLAVEAALPLSAGGAAPAQMLATLQKRKSEPVMSEEDGSAVGCGDAARDQAIDDTIAALQALDKTPAMARMVVPVDLANPKDVVTRGWLRAASVTTSLVPMVSWPAFQDDVLWNDARARQGVVHSENLPFIMVAVVEFGVILAKLLSKMQGGGRLPFPSTAVQTAGQLLTTRLQGNQGGWRGALQSTQRVLLKGWMNLFYAPTATPREAHALPQASSTAAGGGDSLDSGWRPVALGQNPQYGPKAEAMARKVLPFYVDWGPELKLLVIPVIADARCEMAHKIARHLENHAQVTLSSSTTSAAHIGNHPTAGLVLDAALPDLDWRGTATSFEVWETLNPFDTYLDFLAATSQPAMPLTSTIQPSLARQATEEKVSNLHVPLKRKLQMRRGWFGSFGN